MVNLLFGRGLGLTRAGWLVGGTTTPTDAEFAQNQFQGAEVGKGRLQQVEAHKRCKPEPLRAVVMCQHQANKYERPRKPTYDHFHNLPNILFLTIEQQLSKRLQPGPDFRV